MDRGNEMTLCMFASAQSAAALSARVSMSVATEMPEQDVALCAAGSAARPLNFSLLPTHWHSLRQVEHTQILKPAPIAALKMVLVYGNTQMRGA